MTAGWLALRYFGSWKHFFNLTTSLSVLGMVIGVSSLVVSMAVFSGYTATLEDTVQDAFGHLIVMKRGGGDQQELIKEIEPAVRGLVGKTPFVYAEAILAHKGKIAGVLVEGVDPVSVHEVLNLKARVIRGSMAFDRSAGDEAPILIGKGLADRFGLQIGEVIRLVVPLATEFQAASVRPKLGKYRVAGVISYGRYDFDSRYIVMPLQDAQDFAEIGDRITGYRLKLENAVDAKGIAQKIINQFGGQLWARDWQDINRNLFEAARLEKAILFLVLMILVVAAAFNIANTLFISVVRRYHDISVLKTLGANESLIRRIFVVQGLLVGGVGAVLGVVLGMGLCQVLEWAQTQWQIVPAEVYKIDHIELKVQSFDLLTIVLSAVFVCFVATLVPARRGAKISPVEGLRYE